MFKRTKAAFCFRYLGLGRYAGYTQGSSEYSVKSLTDREAAKIIDPSRVHLFSPRSLHTKQTDLKDNRTTETSKSKALISFTPH